VHAWRNNRKGNVKLEYPERFLLYSFFSYVLVLSIALPVLLQGDLKTFLRATSDDSCTELPVVSGRLPPLSVAQRITMCGQVALGMEHIADRGLTHRDLAARNVLLSPSLHLKVCQLNFAVKLVQLSGWCVANSFNVRVTARWLQIGYNGILSDACGGKLLRLKQRIVFWCDLGLFVVIPTAGFATSFPKYLLWSLLELNFTVRLPSHQFVLFLYY